VTPGLLPEEPEREAERARRPSRVERDRVIDALCEHYAQDQLEMGDLERLLDQASRVDDRAELLALLDGLKPLTPAPLVKGGGREEGRSLAPRQGGSELSTQHAGGRPGSLAERVPNSQLELAVWSGRVRKGSWVPARTIRVAAFMGGVELDFREARFGPGEVRVHIGAVMGGVEVLVPPGIHVEASGLALLGGFEQRLEGDAAADPDAPVLRITGFALLGGVEIETRLPGETPKEARRRRKGRGGKDGKG
jgi:hypothetical protein